MDAHYDPQTTVGQLVAERPGRSRIFETLKINYCCGGKKPLAEVCLKRGLDIEAVLEILRQADAQAEQINADDVDPDTLSLTDLTDHIEQKHHAYLREEFPRLDTMTEKVFRVHGKNEPRLAVVRQAYRDLRDELTSHMKKEEKILFPMIRQLEQTNGPISFHCGSIANPIQQMELEHDHAGNALTTIRTATDDFQPPEWACNTYRAMIDALAQLEHDLHLHIHKENNILFPKAIDLEQQALAAFGHPED